MPLLSDGDLAAAFTTARPALRLRLDVRPAADCEQLGVGEGSWRAPRLALTVPPPPPAGPLLEDWDIISPREVAAAEPPPPPPAERRSLLAAAVPFTQALWAQVSTTPPGSLSPSVAPQSFPYSSLYPSVYCQHLRCFFVPICNIPVSFLTLSVLLY